MNWSMRAFRCQSPCLGRVLHLILMPMRISTYTIGPFQSKNGERSKLKVKVRLNLHGIVFIDSAAECVEAESWLREK
ncbi:hypothetical protein MKX03_003574 [Papaver bracteatum]|nr:hypothetical protein MKX03_003574 [Papaver bracteatum]